MNKTIFDKNKFNLNIDNLVFDLNSLFKNHDVEIKNLLAQKNITLRDRIVSLTHALIYKFKYVEKYKTQNNTINDYKMDNNIQCNNKCFINKENKIPLEYYETVFHKITNIYNKYSNKTNYTIIAVDGTYNNTNYKNNGILETSLNMGYYDINNAIPVSLDPIIDGNNCEIKSFINFINKNKDKMKNIIFVCDRAYFSYDLMDFLNNNNYKFVIRIKNNCIHLNQNKKKNKKENTYKIPNDTRFINYNFNKEYTRILYNNKTKMKESYKITEKINCNIATNLDESYTPENIKNIYNSRWSIEEYFKFIKSNFKFSLMREHNKNTIETYKKTFVIIKIYSVLEKLIELMCDGIMEKQNTKYNIKINKTQIIHGLFVFISKIISSNINRNNLLLFYNIYVNLNYTKKNSHNPRVSKIPFTKWYIKEYQSKYEIEKIFNAYNSDDKTILNNNLKIRLKNYTFEKYG
jgi:hypothetical protein